MASVQLNFVRIARKEIIKVKILMINSVCGIRSTGRICTDLAQELEAQGHEVKIAYGRAESVPEQFRKYAVRIGNNLDLYFHAFCTRLLDNHGFGSGRATKEFLKWADAYTPDLLWLHNIHGYYINIELLFQWIKGRPQMKVIWTFHDCWAFTGHCAYFTVAKCEKWRTGCQDCPQKNRYPASLLLDRSRQNYLQKRALFTGVRDMTLIMPSKWLANLVKQSFLNEYPAEVCYNTINTEVFKPTPSNFREQWGLKNKRIILGVASEWGDCKGFPDFLRLSEMLDSSYVIVLVGLRDAQIRKLRRNMIGIRRTDNASELAQIYSAADVFFNPTYEDNYPTVNLEAQACGIPVVTYASGGAAETIYSKNSVAVPTGNLKEGMRILTDICKIHSDTPLCD